MSFIVNYFTAAPKELSAKEISRYMGICGSTSDFEIQLYIQELLPRFLAVLNCKACWMEVPVSVNDGVINMELTVMESENLSNVLKGCSRAILFAATIGSGADRLCKAASVSAPSKALFYDAMGSTAIEWFCDTLCDEISRRYSEFTICPRFSPGYGDLPLSLQTDLLHLLDAPHRIGLTLSESLMMIPQKSVTAIVGLKSK